MTREILTPEKIRETAGLYQRSKILLTSYELGVYTFLDDGPKTSEETARALRTEPHATDRLMNALTSLGYLEKKDGKFFNSEGSAKYLVKGKPDYMKSLGHSVNMWYSWNNLTQSIYQGKPAYDRDIDKRGRTWLENFIAAMDHRSRFQAEKLAGMLDLKKVNKMLDLGGGSGAFCSVFLEKNENMHAVIFDLPNVIPITGKYVSSSGLQERITMRAGDFLRDDFGSGYDMIFLSAIIHMNSVEQNRQLVKKCSEALNEGGILVIQDFLVNEERTGPIAATVFAINMLVNTEAGDTYTESEVKAWFDDAGFANFRRRDTDFGTSLVTGEKK